MSTRISKKADSLPAVLITGASRGLGFALTHIFLEAGWRVYAVSRTRKQWEKARARLPENAWVSHKALDLTAEPAVKALARGFKGKRLDLLINNAGYGGGLVRLEKTALSEYRHLMDANLLSVFLMCKHFVPVFRLKKGGFIMNVSSMAGQRAVPKVGVYSAAKFGVLALSQVVAKENYDVALKCLTVCPGGMNTEMRAAIFGPEDAARQQSPDFVARTMLEIVQNKIHVETGGDIVIRHGKITAIHPCPEP